MDFEGKYRIRVARDNTNTMPRKERLWYHKKSKVVLGGGIFIALVASLGLGFVAIRQLFSQAPEAVLSSTFSPKGFTLAVEQGSAEVFDPRNQTWQNGEPGTLLTEGTRIRTGADGRVTLTAFEGSITRLGANTEVLLTKIYEGAQKQTTLVLRLERGELWANVKPHTDRALVLRAQTQNVTADSTGGIFHFSSNGTETTVAAVEKNLAVAALSQPDPNADKRIFDAGLQELVLTPGFMATVPLGFSQIAPQPDASLAASEWYQWNRALDASAQALQAQPTAASLDFRGTVENGAITLVWQAQPSSDFKRYVILGSKSADVPLEIENQALTKWTSEDAAKTTIVSDLFLPKLTHGTWHLRLAVERAGAPVQYSEAQVFQLE